LAADRPDSRLPIVPVPGDAETEKRKVLSSYRRTQENRTRAINRLHGLFVRAGITTAVKPNLRFADLADAERRAETIRQLRGFEREEAGYLAEMPGACGRRIGELEERMAEQAKRDEGIGRLRSIPGVGPKITYAVTAHAGVERFENMGQASAYPGLTPRVSISGSPVRYGHSTKRGNGYLRALLVPGARALTRSKDGGALKERYDYMTKEKGIGKKKAIARRLGELMYTLLKQKTEYEVRHLGAGGRAGGKHLPGRH
jgi:transposase